MKPLPDPYPIEPLAKPPKGTIIVPGSKSITNRTLILAALSKEKCVLRGALWANDTQVMVDSLWELGFNVQVDPDPTEECNRTITVVGRGGGIPAKKAELYVGNAGTAARFLTALVCLGHGEYTIHGNERMHERPMKDLFQALRQWGAQIQANEDRLPAVVRANGLTPEPITMSTEQSTQFASAMILIERAAGAEGCVSLKDAPDEYGYISMTNRLLRTFNPDFRIEPVFPARLIFWQPPTFVVELSRSPIGRANRCKSTGSSPDPAGIFQGGPQNDEGRGRRPILQIVPAPPPWRQCHDPRRLRAFSARRPTARGCVQHETSGVRPNCSIGDRAAACGSSGGGTARRSHRLACEEGPIARRRH